MINPPDKKREFGEKTLLKYRRAFKETNVNDKELWELKSHFEEMAEILVDAWLRKKDVLSNNELCRFPKDKSEN